MNFFISCAIGLEPVLTDELESIYEHRTSTKEYRLQPTKAGVWVELVTEQYGDEPFSDEVLELGYLAVIWSRTASRVLLPIFESEATVDDLYEKGLDEDWSAYMRPGSRVAIEFNGKNKHIRHSGFGALKIKDAIADWHKERDLALPELVKRANSKNCLLYTSPSPRDKRQSRMPSSA